MNFVEKVKVPNMQMIADGANVMEDVVAEFDPEQNFATTFKLPIQLISKGIGIDMNSKIILGSSYCSIGSFIKCAFNSKLQYTDKSFAGIVSMDPM